MANLVRFLEFRQFSLSKSQQLYIPQSVLKRLWWHTYGLATVFGLLFLLVSSLIFLNFHWFSRNLTSLNGLTRKCSFKLAR